MKSIFITFFLFAVALFNMNAQETNDYELAVSDFQVTYDRNPIYEGDIVQLSVVVTNNGTLAQSWRSSVSFYLGETRLGGPLIVLDPGASATYTQSWTASKATASSGKFSVKLPDDYVMGDNEIILNEEVTVVRKYANELLLSGLSILSGEESYMFYEGDLINIGVKVTNQGRDAQNNVPVAFYMGENLISTQTITSIEAEADADVSITWPAELGIYDLKIVLPDDENTPNNEVTRQVTVFVPGQLAESFESATFPPAGWTSEGSWTRTSYGQPHGAYYTSCYTKSMKLITPKLNIQSGDVLGFYASSYSSSDFRISASVDMASWEEVEIVTLTNAYAEYQINFNDTENTAFIGKMYLAFEMILPEGSYGGVSLDMVHGPQLVVIEEDLAMTGFKTSGYLQEGIAGSFAITVKNNGTKAVTKELYIKHGDELLVSGSSGSIGIGEEKTILLEWTPTEPLSPANFSASIEADDADGNNFASLKTVVYPAEPLKLPLFESFEQSTSLDDYPYWNVASNGVTWRIMTGYSIYGPSCSPYEGANVLGFNSGAEGTTALATPLYSLPHDEYTISFQLRRDDNSYHLTKEDRVNIYFNSLAPDTEGATLLGTVHRSIDMEPVVDAPAWYGYSYNIDAKELSQGFFILEGISPAAASYQHIFIDSLTIDGISGYDLIINDIYPADESLIWGDGNAIKEVKANVKNRGLNPMTGGTIRWYVNDIQQEDVAWEGSLEAGATEEVALGEFFFAVGEEHIIKVEIINETDQVDENNALEVTISAMQAITLPYANSFEEETSLDNWLNIDVDADNNTWYVGEEMPKTGINSLISYSFDEVSGLGLTPDNWLISPGIYIAHSKAYLSFYVGAGDEGYFEETYEVLLSTTDPVMDAFTSIHKETLTSNAYKEITIELNNYKGKTIFLALRHFESTEMYYITIDDISMTYPEIYTITATADPAIGGNVSGAGEYIAGDEVILKATENEGYQFTNWTSGSSVVSTDADYTFTVTGSKDFTANFLAAYTVTTSVTPEGSGTVTGAGNYLDGQSVTVTATANANYQFVNWTSGGTEVSTAAEYTFTVTGNTDLVANFELVEHTVSVIINPESAGTVTGAGQYPHGEWATLTATANTGYAFVNWTMGGTAVGSELDLRFPVESDIEVTANFEKITYTIEVNTEGQGTVSPAENVTIEHGESQTFTITPATNWEVDQVLVDGTDQGKLTTYTFSNVTADHTIKVVFIQTVSINSIDGMALEIYPNPFTETIHIKNASGVKTIVLTDITGKAIFTENIAVDGEHIIRPAVANGIYLMTVIMNNGSQMTKKFIKK